MALEFDVRIRKPADRDERGHRREGEELAAIRVDVAEDEDAWRVYREILSMLTEQPRLSLEEIS